MSFTKEMIISVEDQVHNFSDQDLITYNNTYINLNSKYPNSYFSFMIDKSREEIVRRGLLDAEEDRF